MKDLIHVLSEAKKDRKCPKCGSTDVEFFGRTPAGPGNATFRYECKKCGATWLEYKNGEMVKP